MYIVQRHVVSPKMSQVRFGCFAPKTRPSEVNSLGATKFKSFRAVSILYKTIELLSCLDFGYFEHKSFKNRIIWKLFTIFRAICMVTAFMLIFDYDKVWNWSLYWAIYQMCIYFLTVLILVCFNPNKTFCRLHHDLALIDDKFSIDVTTYNIEKKIIFWNVFVIISNIGENHIFCSYHSRTCSFMALLPRMIFTSCLSFLSVVYVSKAFIFYSLTCRLNCLMCMLKSENIDINSMQTCYKNIVEVAELYKAAFDPLVSR